MELIEKALAKARASAASKPDKATPGAAATAPVAPVAQAAPTVSAAPVKKPENGTFDSIAYSQTQVSEIAASVWAENRLVAHSNEKVADLFRMMRTKILQAMRDNGWRTIALVGATAGVGKSTIAANLALSIALDANQTVLLVDADLRKPRVASYFGLEVKKGLGDYLVGEIALDEVLVNPGVERLVLLPSCGTYADSTELLSSRKMANLVTDLKTRYESRVVIFDMPPLLASGDALSFLPNFDCALLVVENGGNTAAELGEAQRMLQKTNLIGWVLNKADAGPGGYYSQHYYTEQR